MGHKMKVIGLTGSIGMGKTTTAQMFAALGCPVFDADAAVHALYKKNGKAVPLIRAVFPDAVVDGAIDRKKLGAHMRADPLNLSVLESFIHPWIAEMRADFLARAQAANAKAIIYDVPLLFETGMARAMDAVVVVSAPTEVQRARVLARPGMTEAMLDTLLSRQMPDAEKRARADYVISTGEGLDAARAQVKTVLSKILES